MNVAAVFFGGFRLGGSETSRDSGLSSLAKKKIFFFAKTETIFFLAKKEIYFLAKIFFLAKKKP